MAVSTEQEHRFRLILIRAQQDSPASGRDISPQTLQANASQQTTAGNTPSATPGRTPPDRNLLPSFDMQKQAQGQHRHIPSLSAQTSPSPTLQSLINETLPGTSPRTLGRALSMHAKKTQWDENIAFIKDVDLVKGEIEKQITQSNKLQARIEQENQDLFQRLFDQYFKPQPDSLDFLVDINIAGQKKTKLIKENADHKFTLQSFIDAQAEIRALVLANMSRFQKSPDYQLGVQALGEKKEMIHKISALIKKIDSYLKHNDQHKNWTPCCCQWLCFVYCQSDYHKAQVFRAIQTLRSELPQTDHFTFEDLKLKTLISSLTTAIDNIIDSFNSAILGQRFEMTVILSGTRTYLENSAMNYIADHSHVDTLTIKPKHKA